MSIVLRCCECNRYYALSNEACPACGHENRNRQYHIRYDGKAVYAGNSLRIAREMEAKMKSAKRLGRISEYNLPRDLYFHEFIKKYYDPHYSGFKDARCMKSRLDYFSDMFKGKTMRGITPADIEQAVTVRTVGKSPRTRDHYLATIRRVFTYTIELEFMDRSPVKMQELKVDNTRRRYLTDSEAMRLLDECAKSRSKYLYPMVLIALHTGMRLGEIQSLKKDDIVDGKFYLKGSVTKNNRVKILPINETLKEYLNRYLAEHNDFDFRRNCRTTFNKAVKAAGIKDFRFHDLRHTFASKLKAQNINDSVIQKLLGHSSPMMVQRYAHLSPDSVLKAIEVVDYAKQK